MAKNYIIGIGGTGARVIESAVHLCAAGFGPEELKVFLIDPDAGNGNLTRTKTIIANYKKCRDSLERTENFDLFKTNIVVPDPFVWEIFSKRGETLANWINHSNMEHINKDLFDFTSLLFSENELNTSLDEGFRGHPAIGSVVMSDIDMTRQPFSMLAQDLNTGTKVNDIRIFIAGSVFGGTGAAGFPTLGANNVLKYCQDAKMEDGKSKIFLGGALVLPYFSVASDANAEGKEKMFVTSKDFPIATKAALQYYNEKELGFDEIYFIGDNLNQNVGTFGVGSKKQENNPHYIEVVSSLAAFDFFSQNSDLSNEDKKYFTAVREGDTLSWSDLPMSRNSDLVSSLQKQLKSAITTMTIFSWTFLTYGKFILDSNHKSIKQTWYKNYFKFKVNRESSKDKDPRRDENKDILDLYSRYLKSFIFWITALDDGSGKIKLIDKSKIIENNKADSKELVLLDPMQEQSKNNIGCIITGEASQEKDFSSFIDLGMNRVEINEKRITKAHNKFVNLFYEGARFFAKENYNVN